MNPVYIEVRVEGGVVTGVFSNQDRRDIHVKVVDHDSIEAEGNTVPDVDENLHEVY